MPTDEDLVQVRLLTANYEREFRARMYQATTEDERYSAECGVRHAKGFRKSVEQLFKQSAAGATAGQ